MIIWREFPREERLFFLMGEGEERPKWWRKEALLLLLCGWV
jgi:hypothetical protein